MLRSERTSSRWVRLRKRLARSGHVFFLGLIIACGIEVLVDWNSIFYEISVLRDRVRERGVSYVSMLARSAARSVKSDSRGALNRLTDGLFDDEDVIFVRFTDDVGASRFDRIDPTFAAQFKKERGSDFATYYEHQLTRDILGILRDPVGEQTLMANSRYRDLAQRWSDAVLAATASISTPVPPRPHSVLVLYQQALRTADHARDDAVTWAFGTVEEEGTTAPVGVALVGFSMARTNAAIRTKYLKGLGMVVFFVGLILFQSFTSRRDKLRLLDMEARDASVNAALRGAVPPILTVSWLRASGALSQAESRVDGMLVDLVEDDGAVWLLILDPEGSGVDAAVVALHARAAFRARRGRGLTPDLEEEARALASAAREIPLAGNLGLTLVRATADGEVSALLGPPGSLRQVGGGKVMALKPERELAATPGLLGPLVESRLTLAAGESLIAVSGGVSPGSPRVDVDAVAAFAERSNPKGIAVGVNDAATWARGKTPGQAHRDIVVAAIERLAEPNTVRQVG